MVVTVGLIVGISVALANHTPSNTVPAPPKTPIQTNTAPHADCTTEIDGRMVGLMLGEGLQVAGVWRNCQSYDGHSLIVFSTQPSRGQETGTGE